MKRWRWLRRTAAGAAVVMIITLAITRPGFPVDDVVLNDGSVWITNSAQHKVGRFNLAIDELTGGLRTPSADFDVLQQANDVVLNEVGSLRLIDPGLVKAGQPLALAAGFEVAMGGGVIALTSAEGEIWRRGPLDVTSLRPQADRSDLDLGAGALSSVGLDGTIYSVAVDGAATAMPAQTSAGRLETIPGLDTHPPEAMTVVGQTPVVLAGAWLAWPGGSVDLAPWGREFVLQQVGPASNLIRLASPTALLEVNWSGQVKADQAGGPGNPVAPVYLDGCLHAAWAASTSNYWLRCDREASTVVDLAGITSASQLVFRVNRHTIVLNDMADGRIWLPQEDSQAHHPNWADIEVADQAEKQSHLASPTDPTPQDCAAATGELAANDDDYGLRPGTAAVLRVLENDVATECGALAITQVTPLPDARGQIDIIETGRALQIRLDPAARGQLQFDYVVTDGRKNHAPDTATVHLTITDQATNTPPVVLRPSTAMLESGASLTINVLENFRDPDGDPLTLVSATTTTGLPVTFTADGEVTVSATLDTGLHMVTLLISDGAASVEGQLDVEIRPARTLTPQAEPIKVDTYVDEAITVDARQTLRTAHVDPVTLAAVSPEPGADIEIDQEAGTFAFTAAVPKTYYLTGALAAGQLTASVSIRVDVLPRPEHEIEPVAVVDLAHVAVGSVNVIDPLANDVAPPSAVKILSEIAQPEVPGIKLALIDHQFVEISASASLAEPIWLAYTLVTNSVAVTGSVIIMTTEPTASQPPIAQDIMVTVRTGGVVSVPVMDYATSPDGQELVLDPTLTQPLAQGQGLLFAAGTTLRYQAPSTPMVVQTPYRVLDPQGNAAGAMLTIRVHDSRRENKPKPAPKPLVARTFESETVRIGVPLTGIDVDGDGVTLLGLDTAPVKGRIVDVGPDFFIYEALPDEIGSDSFTYAVEDWVGLRAVATVSVGIAQRPSNSTQVVARDDVAVARPGQLLQMRVLSNDLDMAGGQLSLCGQPQTSDQLVKPTYQGRRVELITPRQAGVIQVVYSACNERGGRDSAVLRVTVDPNAPIKPPSARDVIVSPSDTAFLTTIEVDVLAVAENPSGPLSDLRVDLPDVAPEIARVGPSGLVTVYLQSEPLALAYRLTNTRAGSTDQTAYAFIVVPAEGNFPPLLRPGEETVRVLAGGVYQIPLKQYVRVGSNKTARLADPAGIRATKADDGPLSIGDQVLVYRARSDYAGPASITFAVTDGLTADSPGARTSVLTIPITVLPTHDLAPILQTPQLELPRAGAPRVINLAQFARLPGAADLSKLTFRLAAEKPDYLEVNLEGASLTVAAKAAAPVGLRSALYFSAQYGVSALAQGQVLIEIIPPERGLIALVPIGPQVTREWAPVSVDVLAGAVNPAPEIGPLRLVSAALNPASSGSISIVGSSLTITPSPALTTSAEVTYQVNDGFGDVSRAVTGRFQLTLLARPDRPQAPLVGTPDGKQVALSWRAPNANGSPILDYTITTAAGSTTCDGSPCLVNVEQGQQYSFTLTARNAIGNSDPSPPAAALIADTPPSQVTSVRVNPGDHSLEISWEAASTTGSAVTGYIVQLAGGDTPILRQVDGLRASVAGLVNGHEYSITVTAHNSTGQPGPPSLPVMATPFGDPGAPVLERVVKSGVGIFSVSWRSAAANGDAPTYQLWVSDGRSERAIGPTTKRTTGSFTGAKNGQTYTFWVVASNKSKRAVSSARVNATMWATPAAPTITDFSSSNRSAAWGEGQVAVAWKVEDDQDLVSHHRLSLVASNGAENVVEGAGGVVKQFTGLKAGQYTVTATTCLDTSAISGYVKSDEATCATSRVASLTLDTLPDRPELVKAVRSGLLTVHLDGLTAERTGLAGPGAVTLQYQMHFGNTLTQWRDQTGSAADLPVAQSSGGQVRLRLRTAVGAGPETNWFDFGSWAEPSPEPEPTPTPSQSTRPPEPTPTEQPTPTDRPTPTEPPTPTQPPTHSESPTPTDPPTDSPTDDPTPSTDPPTDDPSPTESEADTGAAMAASYIGPNQGKTMTQVSDQTDQDLDFAAEFHRLVDNIGRVVVGKPDAIGLVLTALFARGHVLIEDAPGTGKTSLARALAASLDGAHKRIQFTPDLLPSDVTGVMVLDQVNGGFTFRPGPVFCSVLLADEINRASPRTQSALLEVMEEGRVTADGQPFAVPQPFMVVATQNPIEQAGTYPLPEAQLDRFLLKTTVGYPDRASAIRLLSEAATTDRSVGLASVSSTKRVLELANLADQVTTRREILDYVLRLCQATRDDPKTLLGASMRGALALVRCAKVWACAQGRDYVLPDDVKYLAQPVLAHRLILDPEEEFQGGKPEAVVARALAETTPPASRHDG